MTHFPVTSAAAMSYSPVRSGFLCVCAGWVCQQVVDGHALPSGSSRFHDGELLSKVDTVDRPKTCCSAPYCG